MSIFLRTITAADAVLCADIHKICFGAAAWTSEQIAGSLSLATTRGSFIARSGNIAGLILCQHAGDDSEILTIGVLPDERNHGLGAKLLQHAIAEAQALHSRKIFLEVAADNAAALGLYAAAGFTPIGRRQGYYYSQTGAIDAIMLQLDLTPS